MKVINVTGLMMNSSNNSHYDYEYGDAEGSSDPNTPFINHAMFYSALIMLASCLVGFYGNTMSIIIFCHSTMRAPINVILNALSVIDTALIILTFPVFIVPSLNALIQSELLHRVYGFGSLYLYPLSMMAHTCSIWTFVLISVERYIAVCTPLKRHRLLTCTRARLTQSAVVLLAILYNIPRFWEYTSHSEQSIVYPYLRENSSYFLYYYVILYTATHFMGPFSAILVLNIFVICALREANKDKLRRVTGSERQQRKTSQMIILITFIFACFTTPPFVISLIEVFDPTLFIGQYAVHAFVVMDISNILVVLNSSSTFLIYLLYCRKYRHLFLYYASKCVCCMERVNLRKWSDERLLFREQGRNENADHRNLILMERLSGATTYV